jgi:hypothetical protein
MGSAIDVGLFIPQLVWYSVLNLALEGFDAVSMLEDCLSPPQHHIKRRREMTPTICPPLLPAFTEEDDEHSAQISSHETVPSSDISPMTLVLVMQI